MKHLFKILCIVMIFSTVIVLAQANAESIELLLLQSYSENVLDAAGGYQYNAGKLFAGAEEVGKYTNILRVTVGPNDTLSIATMTMTLYVPVGDSTPESMILQGVQNITKGTYTGSISAASKAFAPLIGASFSGDTATKTLKLSW